MIVRRFGSRMHQVTPNFDARAMTEISFMRGNALEDGAEEWLDAHERVEEHRLTAQANGDVQNEAEESLLRDLEAQLTSLASQLGEGEVLMVENEAGTNYPKTRLRQKTLVVDGANRLHFDGEIDPPLIVGRYRRRT
ncbi:MAG: hypothetical protein ACREKM_11890 [Longimicrobiales bacterium]